MSDVFEALTDATRRNILNLLREQDLPAGHIAEHFPQQRPAISKHLRILREARLLHVTNDRQSRIYSLDAGALADVTHWVRELAEPKGKSRTAPSLPTLREPTADRVSPGIAADDRNFSLDWD